MSTPLVSLESLFKALADRTRLRILGLLLGGEVCVCDLHEALKIPQPRASRHLAYLRRAGLVEPRREGLWVHYRLAPAADRVIRTLVGTVTHCLAHVPEVGRDRQRMERNTGCCALQIDRTPGLACCERPGPKPDARGMGPEA